MAHKAQTWFGSKAGPKQGALVLEDGTLIHLDYTNYADGAKVRANRDAVATVNLTPYDGKWAANTQHPITGATLWNRGFDTAQDCADDILVKIAAAVADEEAVLADPVVHLERELACHDWYSMMSDDHSVWAGGNAHWKLICDLMGQVPPEKARELFAAHVPTVDHVCPV